MSVRCSTVVRRNGTEQEIGLYQATKRRLSSTTCSVSSLPIPHIATPRTCASDITVCACYNSYRWSDIKHQQELLSDTLKTTGSHTDAFGFLEDTFADPRLPSVIFFLALEVVKKRERPCDRDRDKQERSERACVCL